MALMLRAIHFLNYRDYEDIESAQTVGLDCGRAGKAEESGVWGNSLHRCCCFQRRNGELRNANKTWFLSLIIRNCSASQLQAPFKSTKRKRVSTFWSSVLLSVLKVCRTRCVRACVMRALKKTTCFSNWNVTWFTRQQWDHFEGVPRKKLNQVTSKQQQKQQTRTPCALSANSVWDSICLCLKGGWGGGGVGWELLPVQELLVQMSTPSHTHTLHSRTECISKLRQRDSVPSLSRHLIICLEKARINGKHSVYVNDTLIVSVAKANLWVFISPERSHCVAQCRQWDSTSCLLLIFKDMSDVMWSCLGSRLLPTLCFVQVIYLLWTIFG